MTAVDHRVEERPPRRRSAGRLGDGAVEHVGDRGEDDQDQADPESPGADRDDGGDGHEQPEAVRWSAVMPVRRRFAHGPQARSKLVRHWPSNIVRSRRRTDRDSGSPDRARREPATLRPIGSGEPGQSAQGVRR